MPRKGQPRKKWTVMVFMGADNAPGETDLTEAAKEDIEEMTQAVSEPTDLPETLKIVYQLHTKAGATRRMIGSAEKKVEKDDQDPADGHALTTFIQWALKTAKHSRNDYVMLVLWGHAHHFAISARELNGQVDALDYGEVASTLRHIRRHLLAFQRKIGKKYGDGKLDVIGFDACDASTVELAYQLHPFANYLLASQIRMPIPGWPYQRMLERLHKPQGDRLMGPAEFGSYAVRRFCEWYSAGTENFEAVSLTLLDLKKAPKVFKRAEQLARRLAQALFGDSVELDRVLELFRMARVFDTRPKPFVDVAELCLNLYLGCRDEEVRDAALELGDFLVGPPKPTDGLRSGHSELGDLRPFVVEHGRNACITTRLHGVSLYAPHVAGDVFDWASVSSRYAEFTFAQKTLWADLIRAFVQPV